MLGYVFVLSLVIKRIWMFAAHFRHFWKCAVKLRGRQSVSARLQSGSGSARSKHLFPKSKHHKSRFSNTTRLGCYVTWRALRKLAYVCLCGAQNPTPKITLVRTQILEFWGNSFYEKPTHWNCFKVMLSKGHPIGYVPTGRLERAQRNTSDPILALRETWNKTPRIVLRSFQNSK